MTYQYVNPYTAGAQIAGHDECWNELFASNVIGVNREIKYAGAAAINDLGLLDEKDVDGTMWIKGKGIGGTVKNYEKQKTDGHGSQ
ncbi:MULTISPECIES: hypothetical protein [Bacillus]|uniref:hypothetical protein n=1 Tax=Bacillus TaxID=1386 RepID=UPI001E4CBDC6|nr:MULTISPECIES: hypothetical protein [Bacillus]MCD2369751.1 hypothetical protein [Bacillus sp. BS3(2021)]MCJ8231144.1 hypothetical protein [Bacillus paralicheniformis]MCY8038364.1 hypothetical protein [Bacillus paralicheniformis]MCY8152742.1 hypothetical protein [Bacillus paralicheniformis]MCY9422614.1 hypothetical protein [Bacillus paralicheniformis]